MFTAVSSPCPASAYWVGGGGAGNSVYQGPHGPDTVTITHHWETRLGNKYVE